MLEGLSVELLEKPLGLARREAEAVGEHIQGQAAAVVEEAKRVYCIIATGETALYANIMLQKGVVTE